MILFLKNYKKTLLFILEVIALGLIIAGAILLFTRQLFYGRESVISAYNGQVEPDANYSFFGLFSFVKTYKTFKPVGTGQFDAFTYNPSLVDSANTLNLLLIFTLIFSALYVVAFAIYKIRTIMAFSCNAAVLILLIVLSKSTVKNFSEIGLITQTSQSYKIVIILYSVAAFVLLLATTIKIIALVCSNDKKK